MSVARTVHAEWTKLRTITSTAWLLVAAVVLMVAVSAGATASVDTSMCPTPTECHEDTTKLSLTGIWISQVAVVVLAVLAMSHEYGTGTIHTTLATNPRRPVILLAKATVITVLALAVGTIGVLGSVAAGGAILPGNGFTSANGYSPLSLADDTTLRAAAGTVLYLALVGLFSLGIATIVRDAAGAITTVLCLLYGFPVVAEFVNDLNWSTRLRRYGPMEAGLSIQATRNFDRLFIQPWPGLGVLAAYTGAALILGTVLFTTRDA